MPPRTSLSVVVPVYRSAEGLHLLVQRIENVLLPHYFPFELILVNDGSPDDSWRVILELAATRPWVRGVNLMRNFGQHNALLCGIREARYEFIVTMDDDLQNPPEEAPRLLERLNRPGEEADVVYGNPVKQTHGLLRDLASTMTKIGLQGIMGSEVARHVGPYRAFRTQLRDAFAQYNSPSVSIDALLTWGARRFAWIQVRNDPRALGVSNYTFRKLVAHALDMMTGFSVLPLQVASIVGFAFTLFGVAVLAYVLGRYLWSGSSVAGFPFLASVIAIFSGTQLFALGVIGEYLARMHVRLTARPAYVVQVIAEERRGAKSA